MRRHIKCRPQEFFKYWIDKHFPKKSRCDTFYFDCIFELMVKMK